MVRTFLRVRAAGVLAIAVVALVAWMVARTMERARESTDWLLVAVGLAAIGLIGWVMWVLAREASRERHGADALRHTAADLEGQVAARTIELRDANARLRTIIDSAVDGIIVIDAAGRIESFNRGAERLFGYPASEVARPQRQHADAVAGPRAARRLSRPLSHDRRGEDHRVGREVTGRRRDGTTFPLHLSVGEMSIAGERKFTGMLHDLTERGRLEDELRASEARWRAIIESAVDGIIVIDAHGRIEAFNPAAERLFGYAASEVAGRNVNMLMPSPYHEEHDDYLSRYLATGARKIIGIGREVTGLRKDGTTFPLHLSVGEMNVRRRAEVHRHPPRSRARACGWKSSCANRSTLARLGEMAAVIAHEVKNPLAGIRGAIQVIGGRLPDGSRDVEMIARNRRADRRAQRSDEGPAAVRAAADAAVRAGRSARAGHGHGRSAQRRSGVQARSASWSTGTRRRSWPTPSCCRSCSSTCSSTARTRCTDGGTIEVSVTATGEPAGSPSPIRARHSAGDPRQDLHAVRHDQVARHRAWACRPRSGSSRRIAVRSPCPVPTAGGTTVTVHLPAGLAPPSPAGR